MTEKKTSSNERESKAGAVFNEIVRRLWALVILAVVVWTGYAAVEYLIGYVFEASRVPKQLVADPMDLHLIASGQSGNGNVPERDRRPPLDHYHLIKGWALSSERSGCSASGCHSTLPHRRDKDLRAFANMHTTFAGCRVCHVGSTEPWKKLAWIDNETGERVDPPVLLKLLALVEDRPEDKTKLQAFHDQLVTMLRLFEKESPADPLLVHLRLEMETSEINSPVWRRSVASLTAELPRHARGEYGARIMLPTPEAGGVPSREELESLAAAFRDLPESSEKREEILERAHAGVEVEPPGCIACHQKENRQFPFAALGYSKGRTEELEGAPIARMLQHIHEGRPFTLPGLLKEATGQ